MQLSLQESPPAARPKPQSLVEAEAAFSALKEALKTGWDKVSITALHTLEAALVRCLEQPDLTPDHRRRLAQMYDALRASWQASVGIFCPAEDIEQRLDGVTCRDEEFETLRANASTRLADLRASARIIVGRLLRKLPGRRR